MLTRTGRRPSGVSGSQQKALNRIIHAYIEKNANESCQSGNESHRSELFYGKSMSIYWEDGKANEFEDEISQAIDGSILNQIS